MSTINHQFNPQFKIVHHVIKLFPIMLVIFLFYPKITAFFMIFIVVLLVKYFIYKKASFKLGEFSAHYEVDFIMHSHTTVRYKDIKELIIARGPIQKFFGLGTIRIISHATTENAGITIYNIKNYQEIYDFLREKIK